MMNANDIAGVPLTGRGAANQNPPNPMSLADSIGLPNPTSLADLSALLPFPADDANKYTRGKLVAVAGCAEYPGAACLAASAGQRAGAGYIEVFCAPSTVPIVQAFRPSLVARDWTDFEQRALPASAPGKPVAYVVGPGFDRANEECQHLTLFVLEHAQAPVLVDGGALGILASPEGLALAKRRLERGLTTVITPHAGEAARLMEIAARTRTPETFSHDNPCSIASRKPDRTKIGNAPAIGEKEAADKNRNVAHAATSQEETARTLAFAYGAVVAAKGPNTFVSDGERTVAITNGTPALAKAGTGDVLAGMAGAFLAQGLDPFDAAALACALHAEAGKLAERTLTSISVIPEDVIEHIPAAIKQLTAAAE